MDQTVVLSTSSLPIALAVLFLITVVPVKLGAGFVGAMGAFGLTFVVLILQGAILQGLFRVLG